MPPPFKETLEVSPRLIGTSNVRPDILMPPLTQPAETGALLLWQSQADASIDGRQDNVALPDRRQRRILMPVHDARFDAAGDCGATIPPFVVRAITRRPSTDFTPTAPLTVTARMFAVLGALT